MRKIKKKIERNITRKPVIQQKVPNEGRDTRNKNHCLKKYYFGLFLILFLYINTYIFLKKKTYPLEKRAYNIKKTKNT